MSNRQKDKKDKSSDEEQKGKKVFACTHVLPSVSSLFELILVC